MASAKKRRGRERKAARKNASNDRNAHSNGGKVSSGRDNNNNESQSSSAIISHESIVRRTVEGVRRGSDNFTLFASSCLFDTTTDIRIIDGLIKEGLLDATLGLLGRCNEDFGSVMCDIGGGDLQTPASWVVIIERAVTVSIGHSQIIDNIGPLVSCMCDDVERKFFGSKKYWHESILPFIAMIERLLVIDSNVTKLCQYEGLFERVAQWWFWQYYRPDIVDELKAFITSTSDVKSCLTYVDSISGFVRTTHLIGEDAMFRVIEWVRKTMKIEDFSLINCMGNENAKKMLGDIGPIVSRAYDPNCKVSFVGGIIRHMKNLGDRRKYFQALTIFIHCADCVDKDVITEMIDYGFKFTSEYEDANVATQLIFSMISQKMEDGSQQPNDSRTAFAIRAGLLDLCMKMIACFGGVNNAGRIMISVSSILQNVYFLSFHKKTSKAIGAKRGHLISELERLRENQQLTNNDSNECKLALCMIQSIIDITSTNCFVCNKVTERKDMKKCAACKSVCYCSKECQRIDWQNGGHDCACEIIIDGMNKVDPHSLDTSLDTSEREAAKLKALERNMMMAQNSLFLEHAGTIRERLAAKGLPCSEYLVHFDLGQCPLAVKVMKYNECLHSGMKNWLEEIMRSDGSILCIYQSPFFSGKTDTRYSVLHRLFPVGWISPATNEKVGVHSTMLEEE